MIKPKITKKKCGLGCCSWEQIESGGCLIELGKCNPTSTDGNYIVRLDAPNSQLVKTWPRYYFSKKTAKAEIKAWLKKNRL